MTDLNLSPIAVAVAFARYVEGFPDEVKFGLIGGVAERCLQDMPERMRKEFLEYLASKFNMGFFRVEDSKPGRSNPAADAHPVGVTPRDTHSEDDPRRPFIIFRGNGSIN